MQKISSSLGKVQHHWGELPSFLKDPDQGDIREAYEMLIEDLENKSEFGLPERHFLAKGYDTYDDGEWDKFSFQIQIPQYVFEIRKIPITSTKKFPSLMSRPRFLKDPRQLLKYLKEKSKSFDLSPFILEFLKYEGEESQSNYEVDEDLRLEEFLDSQVELLHASFFDENGEVIEDISEFPSISVKWGRTSKKVLKSSVKKKSSDKYEIRYEVRYGPFKVKDWKKDYSL